jgi:hypothetical protein
MVLGFVVLSVIVVMLVARVRQLEECIQRTVADARAAAADAKNAAARTERAEADTLQALDNFRAFLHEYITVK